MADQIMKPQTGLDCIIFPALAPKNCETVLYPLRSSDPRHDSCKGADTGTCDVPGSSGSDQETRLDTDTEVTDAGEETDLNRTPGCSFTCFRWS